jgi:exodeoxyribonuclease VII large subunit
VISAVGHEIDVTIADFVADLRAPTPSAAAELVAASRLELERHLDHLVLRLAGQIRGRLALWAERVAGFKGRLRSPLADLAISRQRHLALERRLLRAWQGRLRETAGQLATLGARLDALSPLRTLERGYAVAVAEKDGRVVTDARDVAAGDRLQLLLARGRARVVVEGTDA